MANCRGWNDPPTLDYQPTATSRLVLSRRPNQAPGFTPKSQGNSPAVILSPASGPPQAPPIGKQPVKSTMEDTESNSTKSEAPSSLTGSDVIDQLSCVVGDLERVFERQKSQLDKRLSDDVKRRLGILKSQWESGALSPPVMEQLMKLVTALEVRDKRAAHDIHVSLMVNHVTEVNQWMVGVKRLIVTLQDDESKKCEESRTDMTDSSLPNGSVNDES